MLVCFSLKLHILSFDKDMLGLNILLKHLYIIHITLLSIGVRLNNKYQGGS